MKDNSRFYIPVLSFLVLTSVVLLAAFINGPSDSFQSYVCEISRCTLQDWLSATAGWVGFVAAAIAAYLVLGQLNEQRKQTDFMLGNALPTMEQSMTALKGRRSQFEFVNWNRRRARINHVTITCDGIKLPEPKYLDLFNNGKKYDGPLDYDDDGTLKYALFIGGWLDRQSPPPMLRFEFCFEKNIEDFSEFLKGIKWKKAVVTVAYEIDGEKGDLISITSLAHLLPGQDG